MWAPVGDPCGWADVVLGDREILHGYWGTSQGPFSMGR